MKVIFSIILSCSMFLGCTDQNVPVYRNPNKPVEKRVRNLISMMTLEEKADMLAGKDFWHFKGIERLGVPSIQVTDCRHGVTVILNETGEGTGCIMERGNCLRDWESHSRRDKNTWLTRLARPHG